MVLMGLVLFASEVGPAQLKFHPKAYISSHVVCHPDGERFEYQR